MDHKLGQIVDDLHEQLSFAAGINDAVFGLKALQETDISGLDALVCFHRRELERIVSDLRTVLKEAAPAKPRPPRKKRAAAGNVVTLRPADGVPS